MELPKLPRILWERGSLFIYRTREGEGTTSPTASHESSQEFRREFLDSRGGIGE